MKKIYLFNAGHETEVLYNSPSYTPPFRNAKITKDFRALPIWFAERDDLVLVDDLFDEAYYEYLKDCGLKLPPFLKESELSTVEGIIIPWGLSLSVINRLKPLCKNNDLLKLPVWNNALLDLNSRLFSRKLILELKKKGLLPDFISVPKVFDNIQELEFFIDRNKSTDFLAKAPFSSSGIGLVWIRNGLAQSEMQILNGIFKRQGEILLENVYNKVLDFAFEFVRSENESFTFEGISAFQTNMKGAYVGNILDSQLNILKHISSYVSLDRIEKYKKYLEEFLNINCKHLDLHCIGIDMMIIQHMDIYYLHPCVEINLRFNMGYVAVQFFKKYVQEGSKGSFKVKYGTAAELAKFANKRKLENPLKVKNYKIISGYMSLTAIALDTNYMVYVDLD